MEETQQHEEMEIISDSDSSSSEDGAEEALIAKAEELERQISDNKYLYNAHEELVSVYRQLGDLTSMRLAYERFHEYFPLTPEIWLAWINDEKKLANSETEIKHVFSLFDKAVQDYLSVNLWVEYAQYSIGVTTLEATRQILERGLTAAGLHIADGSLLWDTLRELEFAHLSLVEQDTDQWKEQLSKIVEVFRRQLSIPLLEMEGTYTEWKDWLQKLPENHKINTEPIEWGYKKAVKTLETYKPFEDKLQRTKDEGELLQIYRGYIKILTDPSTIICVYERGVAHMCLNPNIWQDYCIYAMKLGEPVDAVSAKALRNCPWSEHLWILRLRILEHLNKEENQIMTCFEQAISNLGTNCELWLAYIESVYRTSDNKEKLYKTFNQALDQFRYQEGETKISKWYARLLAKDGNMPEARKLWKNILKIPQNKSSASLWLEFIYLERQFGEISQCRNLFQRALTCCSDWPQYIADEWLMFEREFGKLSDIIKCAEKQSEIPSIQPQRTNEDQSQKQQKRKIESDVPVAKRTKVEDDRSRKIPIVKDPTKTAFVSNLHTTVNEKRLKKFFPNAVNVELVTDRTGKSRCYGYVQFNMEEELMVALARDREPLDGRPIFISNCKINRTERKAGFKYSLETEDNKLFVKGLPFNMTDDDVTEIFQSFGVKDVRIVKKRDGQSKGLAYVEFADNESAQKAMKKTDQMKIGENVITVAISAPPPKKPNTLKVVEPVRRARSKLQIPLVPRVVQAKSSPANNGDTQVKPKSNADFRNMLLSNK